MHTQCVGYAHEPIIKKSMVVYKIVTWGPFMHGIL